MLTLLTMDGDGIGPEIMTATLDVLDTVRTLFHLPIETQSAAIGFASLKTQGTTMPEDVLSKASEVAGLILGPVSHAEYPPVAEGGVNPSGLLRKHLDLFANIRPARSRDGLATATGKAMDLVIVRENTEGFYADRTMFAGTGEVMPTPDLALATRKITRQSSRRIAETAFELAAQRRSRVTAVHKANVLRVSDGLFLSEVRAVAQANPDVSYDEVLVDAMAAHLIRDPSVYDVIVTTNMFGDILSDEATELAGGLGLGGSLNAGTNHAMAQAQHGSAPSLAGQDVANPTSLILSVAMLLRWLGEHHHVASLTQAAEAIDEAVDHTVGSPETRTRDLGGSMGTIDFGRVIAASLISQST